MTIKKVVMCTDIEGVAGVVSFEDQAHATGKYYEAAKQLLTGEVNAAVEGLLAAGVEDVLVIDGHGAGGIVYEALHPAAKLLHGRPLAARVLRSRLLREQGYQAGVMIGQHAMAGVERGTLNHTQNSRTIEYYQLNGKLIGEIAQFSLYCGALDMPMLFLSGDEAAAEETHALIPKVTTAAVKQGLSRSSAISLSIPAAHERIRDGIEAAIRKQATDPVAPLQWPGPYVLKKRFFHSNTADGAAGNPLYERVDAMTVRLRHEDILEIIYA